VLNAFLINKLINQHNFSLNYKNGSDHKSNDPHHGKEQSLLIIEPDADTKANTIITLFIQVPLILTTSESNQN